MCCDANKKKKKKKSFMSNTVRSSFSVTDTFLFAPHLRARKFFLMVDTAEAFITLTKYLTLVFSLLPIVLESLRNRLPI